MHSLTSPKDLDDSTKSQSLHCILVLDQPFIIVILSILASTSANQVNDINAMVVGGVMLLFRLPYFPRSRFYSNVNRQFL